MTRANRWEADNMLRVPFSGIRKVSEAAAQLRREGVDIIEMTMGRPDFDTPKHIKDAAIKALEEGKVHYTSNYGLPQLTQAISQKMREQNGLEYDPSGEIIVTAGACEAIFTTMAALLNAGDEVIVPTPVWGTYLAIPAVIGAKPIEVPLREENEFSLAPEDVEKYITPRTKMIVLISPNNPTGGIMKEEDLRGLVKLAQKYDLLVLADEIYEHLIYTENRHISIASYEGMRERTITINGFSKAYSMTGWRLGWICADRTIISSIVRVHQNVVACANSFAQYGGVAALTGPQDCVQEMREEFNRRRKFFVEEINKMPKIHCLAPAGAFYIFANIKQMNLRSEEASEFFLREAHVAVVPGSAFGAAGEGYLRFAYSVSMEQLVEAARRMHKVLEKL